MHIEKQLKEKYKQIEDLVGEYNKLSSKHKIKSQVGCIITPGEKVEDDEEDSYEEEYSTSGWMPSSIFC